MSSIMRLARSIQTPLILCVLVVAASLLLFGHSSVLDQSLMFALISLIVVVGLYVFIGTSGVVSFGQISFMAVGAYICGMLTIPKLAKSVIVPNAPEIFRTTTVTTVVGVGLGALVAAFFAWLVSIPLMRLSGLAASIATLAVLLIVFTFFQNWQIGTSGSGNLTRIPRDLNATQVLPWAVAAIIVAWLYSVSRFGLRLRASREDFPAARSIGINIHAERRIAFVLSGAIVGIAGGLYSHAVGSISSTDFFLAMTFTSLAMLVLGGMMSLTGAVTGAALLTSVSFVFEQWQNGNAVFGLALPLPAGSRDLVFAAVLLLVLIARPDGITGGHEVPFRRWRDASAPPAEPTSTPPAASPSSPALSDDPEGPRP